MEILELIREVVPDLLSIIAITVAFMKGKKVTALTQEQIEEKEEARKQKRIAKQFKKNKIKPIQDTSETVSFVIENSIQTDKQKGLNPEEFLRDLKTGGENNV